MTNTVSSLSFGSAIGAMDKVSKEKLYEPGAYSATMAELRQQKREQQQPQRYAQRREQMSFLGFLGRIVLTAAVVLGAPLLARKHFSSIKDIDLTQDLAKEAKLGKKIKYYTAKFGEWVDTNIFKKIASKEVKADAKDGAAPKK